MKSKLERRFIAMAATVALYATTGIAYGNPLKSCEIRGESGSVIALATRSYSQYHAFNSEGLDIRSVTAAGRPGEEPTVTISMSVDSTLIQNLAPRNTSRHDYLVTVSRARWEGQPDDKSHTADWKLPVKHGWNQATIHVGYSGGGTMETSIKFFAFVFTVSEWGRLEMPAPGFPHTRFMDYVISDARGNMYASFRSFRSEQDLRECQYSLVRYSPGGAIAARYAVAPSVNSQPLLVDSLGHLYALVMENIVEFAPNGEFVRSVAGFDTSNRNITAEDLRTGQYPRSDAAAGRGVPVMEHFSTWSYSKPAVVGDAIYFVASDYRSGKLAPDPALVRLTLDGRFTPLSNLATSEPPALGRDGLLYMREKSGSSGPYVLLGVSLDGRVQRRLPMDHSVYPNLMGVDGAGYWHYPHIFSPDLHWQAAYSMDLRSRYVPQRQGRGYYIDLLSGGRMTTDGRGKLIGMWFHGGATHVVFEHDLRVARVILRAPGAEVTSPPDITHFEKPATPPTPNTPRRPDATAGNPPIAPEPPTNRTEPPDGTPTDSAVPPGPTPPIGGEPPASTSPEPGGDVTIPPPPADDSATTTDTPDGSTDDSPTSVLSPESAAGGAAVLGGLGAIGAWLTMVSSGVRWKDVADGAHEWLSGTPPTPVEPPQVTMPPRGYDGQTNEQGEVWSDEDRGWVGRNLYEQEKSRRTWLDQKAEDDLHTGQSEDVKRAYDQWQKSIKDREDSRQAYIDHLRQRVIDWQREKVERLERQSDRGVVVSEEVTDFVRGVVKDVKDLGAAAMDGETRSSAWELGHDTLKAAGETVVEVFGSPIQSMKKIGGFYSTVGEELLKWQATAAENHKEGLVQAGRFFSKTLVEPVYNGVHDLFDSHKPITDRIKVIGQVEVMLAMGGLTQYSTAKLARWAEAGITKVGGALGVDTSLLTGKTLPVPGGRTIDTGPGRPPTGKFKPWGTMEREGFAETTKIFEQKTKMMQNMNRVADDLLDPAKKQQAIADLVKLKKSAPAVFNLVKKELNSSTLKTIESASGELNRKILSKTAQELEAAGYKVKVKTAGNPGGADCDALWEVRTKKGFLLNDKNTADLVEKTMGDVVKKDFGHLGATPENLGHKVMNGSPERFAATPDKLGIPAHEGTLTPDGQLQFREVPREGAHWANQKTPYRVRPGELISGDVMNREMAQSLGNVLKTKTDHLIALGADATPADVLDAAREVFKTHLRTGTPMIDRAGVAATQEYQELIRNLRLAHNLKQGTSALPPVSEWDRILQNQVRQIGDALPPIQ